MAVTTKGNAYKTTKKSSSRKMEQGGDVSQMSPLELSDYIDKTYAENLTDASLNFLFYETGDGYDYYDDAAKGQLMDYYNEQADYTEDNISNSTNYKMVGWALERVIFDEDEEEIDTEELTELQSGNTYNDSYLGLIDFNWRLYGDEDYEKYFMVIHPHLGGDPRGNYGKALIIEGDDEEEVFMNFFNNFVSGVFYASFEFNDGSNVVFDSEQDADVFSFRVEDEYTTNAAPDSLAASFIEDFESLSGYDADEFVKETVERYLVEKGQTKMANGGAVGSEDSPRVYIQVLGYPEGQWMDLSDYNDGDDVINGITDWMTELNRTKAGDREEWEARDWDGFGRSFYDQYMSESEFDEVMEAYELFQDSDFPIAVIEGYMKETGKDNFSEALSDMQDKEYGTYSSLSDWAEQLVDEGVYTPQASEMYVTDTDKRLISGDEADHAVHSEQMSFKEALEKGDMEDEFDEKESELQDELTVLEDRLSTLETSADDVEGEDFDVVQEAITEVEEEINEKQAEIDGLEEQMDSRVRAAAQSVVYDEIYDQLDNDLQSFLDNYGYETPQQATFVRVDYEEVGKDLAADYIVLDDDGQKHFFLNYKKGGTVVELGRPSRDYTHYIMEMNSKKIISGFKNKADASAKKAELSKAHPKARFGVYSKKDVTEKYDLDTSTFTDWMKMTEVEYSDKVAVRKTRKAHRTTAHSKKVSKLRKELDKLRDKFKTAENKVRAGIKKDIESIKREIAKLKAKHYAETGSFMCGGSAHADKAKRGGVQSQLVRVKGKLGRIKKVVKRGGKEQYVVTTPDGGRRLGRYDSSAVSMAKEGGEQWIQEATTKMKKKGTVGAFTQQAKKKGMTPVEFAKVVLATPSQYDKLTRERAQFVKNVNPEKFDKGGEIEEQIVLNSSWFDANKYDSDKMIKALKSIGATDIYLEQDRGWSNQPEVVVFSGISKSKAENKLNEVFDTQAISVGTKDWSSTYAEGGEVAGKSKFPVGTNIKIKGLTGEDSDLNGLTGELTHPFAFGEGDVGVWLDKKGVRRGDNLVLLNSEYEVISSKAEGGDTSNRDVNDILHHYLIAGLWSSLDDNEDPLDATYGVDDISPEAKERIKPKIVEFITANKETLDRNEISDEMIGHDLFLDSQGHGVGFWDRGYGDDGNTLSESATAIFKGEETPYVGDDNTVYFASGGVTSKSTSRANRSELIKYANFADNSNINLLRLTPRKVGGQAYSDDDKYAISVSSIYAGQKVSKFKTLKHAESRFDELVGKKMSIADLVKESKTPNYADGGAATDVELAHHSIGDLIFAKDMGARGLVGLVISKPRLDTEYDVIEYDVMFRGFGGGEEVMIQEEMDAVYGGENDHMDFARDNGDLSAYQSIAEQRGIRLNPSYTCN